MSGATCAGAACGNEHGRGRVQMAPRATAPGCIRTRPYSSDPKALNGTGRGGIGMPVLRGQVSQLAARLPAVQKPCAILHRYRYAHVNVVCLCCASLVCLRPPPPPAYPRARTLPTASMKRAYSSSHSKPARATTRGTGSQGFWCGLHR
jgi:hypothetical protein